MRALVAAVVLLAAAGCLSKASDVPAPTDTGPATLPARVVPWSLKECRFIAAVVGVPQSAVAPLLPQGFRSLSPQELVDAKAPHTTDQANLGVEAFSCSEGLGLEGSPAPMQYGSYFTAVEPPAALRRNVGFHFVKWDVLVPDAPRRELLVAYGVPARQGTAAISSFAQTGNVVQVGATLTFDGEGASQVSGNGATPFGDSSFVEYQKTEAGLVAWQTTTHFTVGGVGTATLKAAPGTLAARIGGTETLQGASFLGIVNFPEGRIELPATSATT